MPNYRYLLSKRQGSKTKHIITIDGPIRSEDSVIRHIFVDLLQDLRYHRFSKLFNSFKGNYSNLEDVREYLRDYPQFSPYANNLELLRRELASLYEVSKMYEVFQIEVVADCLGCVNNEMNQLAHMDCNTGCLHDSSICGCLNELTRSD